MIMDTLAEQLDTFYPLIIFAIMFVIAIIIAKYLHLENGLIYCLLFVGIMLIFINFGVLSQTYIVYLFFILIFLAWFFFRMRAHTTASAVSAEGY